MANRIRQIKETTEVFYGEVPVAASQTIENGDLVSIDADGYLIPAADTSGTVFVGYVHEGVDNSGGADGAETCKVYYGTALVTTGTTAQTDMVGVKLYVANDDSVDLAAVTSNDIKCGFLRERVSATEAWVAFMPTAMIP